MLARKEHIASVEGEPAHEGYTPLGELVGTGYPLTFVVDAELADWVFVLFYDDDPDGGGEVPDDDTETEQAARQVQVRSVNEPNRGTSHCRRALLFGTR